MLKDGVICFEGNAEELRRSTDPYLQTFLLLRIDEYASHAFAGLVGTEARRARRSSRSSSPAVTIFAGDGRPAGSSGSATPLKTRFANVAGLKAGSPVRVAGMEVGSVTDVDLRRRAGRRRRSGEQGRPARWITTASIAMLGSVSLLGEGAVDITAVVGRDADSRSGATCRRGSPRPRCSDVTDAGVGGHRGAHRPHQGRARRARDGRQADDRRAAVRRTAAVRRGGRRRDADHPAGPGHSRASLINDPKIANSLEASLKNLEEMTRRINAGEGSLGKLLKDDALRHVADRRDDQSQDAHRPHQQGRGDGRQAGDRSGAVQPAEFADATGSISC